MQAVNENSKEPALSNGKVADVPTFQSWPRYF